MADIARIDSLRADRFDWGLVRRDPPRSTPGIALQMPQPYWPHRRPGAVAGASVHDTVSSRLQYFG